VGARPNQTAMSWTFSSGAEVKFAHLQHEKDKHTYQGAQIPLIVLDELTHFTEGQFFYLLSRNRSTCGVRPYVRTTTNPDADSWVATFISWWIGEDGLPIPERAGVLRWFVRDKNLIVWGDSPAELLERYPKQRAKSVTFIPATLEDNQILMAKDPDYEGNLDALAMVDRERLRKGNWKIRAAGGMYFKRHWFKIVDQVPDGIVQWVRYWDRAATEEAPGKDPDWTVGVLMGKTADGQYIVADVVRMRGTPLAVERQVKATTAADAERYVGLYTAWLEQDPGQAGKVEAFNYSRLLAGFDVRFKSARQDKETRAKPYSAQVEAGNVALLRAHWNEPFIGIHEAFPTPGIHDDDVDAGGGAFTVLTGQEELHYA
jgi:predicted phage terminase large subunit-like protein